MSPKHAESRTLDFAEAKTQSADNDRNSRRFLVNPSTRTQRKVTNDCAAIFFVLFFVTVPWHLVLWADRVAVIHGFYMGSLRVLYGLSRGSIWAGSLRVLYGLSEGSET